MRTMPNRESSQPKIEELGEEQMEIAYNINLENQFDKIKNELWLNEELQIQPIKKRKAIFRYIKKTLFGIQ